MEWRPSGWGQRVTRSPDWRLRLDGEHVELLIEGRQYRQHIDDDQRVRILPGLFWARVALQSEDGETLSVDGLPNGQASRLAAAVQQVLFARTTRGRKALFEDILEQIQSWLAEADALTDRGTAGRRWITHEQQHILLAERPPCPCRRPSWNGCSLMRMCTTTCTPIAIVPHWMPCTTGSWIGPPYGGTPMRPWRRGSWCWPRTSWTGSRASR